MENSINQVGLVIVLYKPTSCEIENLHRLADIYKGCIIDNSPTRSIIENRVGNMMYIYMNENVGIARAQNTAIKEIERVKEIEYIVFLDQDTEVSSDYPQKVVSEYKRIKKHCNNIACLGPIVVNKNELYQYTSAFHRYNISIDGFIHTKTVISSGACIETSIIKKVGYYDASLFIDYVDMEWCWRAESQGYVCGITQNLSIYHQIGGKALRIGKHIILIASPFRYYYIYRNFLWLIRRKYVPCEWKLLNFIKLFLRFFYLPIVIPDGKECWKNMKKGILHGVKQKM